MGLLVAYLLVSVSFLAGWLVRSLWQQPDRNDLCGVVGCVTCQPYERRQPEAIPDYVYIIRPNRPRSASSN